VLSLWEAKEEEIQGRGVVSRGERPIRAATGIQLERVREMLATLAQRRGAAERPGLAVG
jgi:hypothetical protein